MHLRIAGDHIVSQDLAKEVDRVDPRAEGVRIVHLVGLQAFDLLDVWGSGPRLREGETIRLDVDIREGERPLDAGDRWTFRGRARVQRIESHPSGRRSAEHRFMLYLEELAAPPEPGE